MLVFIAVQGTAIVRRDGKAAALLGVAHIHIIVRHIALLARAHKGVAHPGQGVQHRAAVQDVYKRQVYRSAPFSS